MRSLLKRLALVAVAQLVLFESVLQFCVHQRESTEELLTLSVFFSLAVGIIWALMAGFRAQRHPALCRFLAFVPLFVAFYAADYYYSWHVRPNLGFYEEPDWVAQHPDFQKKLRTEIEANKWK